MKALLSLLLATLAASSSAQTYQPIQHTQQPPPIMAGDGREALAQADLGIMVERDRPAAWSLAEHRRLTAAIAAIGPQRKGTVDAFVVVAALDSDAVFGREARAAFDVLTRRYGAKGRAILLAGTDGARDSDRPMGSPQSLSLALARVAEQMDHAEDVLVLYTTSHGVPFGLYYNDGDQGYGAISPSRLWGQLSTLGIRNRLLIISACYSGVFVPTLSSDTTAILTASSADRTSFGCQADSDWTFFGDALINQALRKPQPLAAAASEAGALVASWEKTGKLKPSEPQVSIGDGAKAWIAALERALPAASAPVGTPAINVLAKK
ncbi:C13 family peptidase [Sphingomonas sp. SUN019]|uniref:C13 family peptidase n=1 Tax=Sphingomonas sp. SUN019 TaxID=2937788 RepID=UPI002164D5BD|nr:C13 family peptidase [Sphingomonas sp. SUN019]UVO49614.1 C13 family peptidase [Sphingomonas sp. SUN019]